MLGQRTIITTLIGSSYCESFVWDQLCVTDNLVIDRTGEIGICITFVSMNWSMMVGLLLYRAVCFYDGSCVSMMVVSKILKLLVMSAMAIFLGISEDMNDSTSTRWT